MLKEKIDGLLDRVQKPARYMGGEMNCVLKDPDSVAIRYAFAFPDVYEVGMSHLGSRILYDIINKREDALCERVFMPWVDMADLMRAEDVPLFSLETRTPVGDFDMLGITLQYEMSYTNILEILDLARIPLHSEDRTWDRHRGRPLRVQSGASAPLHRRVLHRRRRDQHAGDDRCRQGLQGGGRLPSGMPAQALQAARRLCAQPL